MLPLRVTSADPHLHRPFELEADEHQFRWWIRQPDSIEARGQSRMHQIAKLDNTVRDCLFALCGLDDRHNIPAQLRAKWDCADAHGQQDKKHPESIELQSSTLHLQPPTLNPYQGAAGAPLPGRTS